MYTGEKVGRLASLGWLAVGVIPGSDLLKAGKIAEAADNIHDANRVINAADSLNDSRKVLDSTISYSKIIDSSIVIRNSGGETLAGHALQKHAGRNPHIWGKIKGNSEAINNQAMKHLDDIFYGPGEFKVVTNERGISFVEKQLSDGRGVRLNLDGTFKGFIDQP